MSEETGCEQREIVFVTNLGEIVRMHVRVRL